MLRAQYLAHGESSTDGGDGAQWYNYVAAIIITTVIINFIDFICSVNTEVRAMLSYLLGPSQNVIFRESKGRRIWSKA